jgi:hypothetical protein
MVTKKKLVERAETLLRAQLRHKGRIAIRDNGTAYKVPAEAREKARQTIEELKAVVQDRKLTGAEFGARAKARRLLQQHRYQLGVVIDLCGFGMFEIVAQGDTLSAVLADLEANEQKRRDREASK